MSEIFYCDRIVDAWNSLPSTVVSALSIIYVYIYLYSPRKQHTTNSKAKHINRHYNDLREERKINK